MEVEERRRDGFGADRPERRGSHGEVPPPESPNARVFMRGAGRRVEVRDGVDRLDQAEQPPRRMLARQLSAFRYIAVSSAMAAGTS